MLVLLFDIAVPAINLLGYNFKFFFVVGKLLGVKVELTVIYLLDQSHEKEELHLVLEHLLVLKKRHLVKEALRYLVELPAGQPGVPQDIVGCVPLMRLNRQQSLDQITCKPRDIFTELNFLDCL